MMCGQLESLLLLQTEANVRETCSKIEHTKHKLNGSNRNASFILKKHRLTGLFNSSNYKVPKKYSRTVTAVRAKQPRTVINS